MLSVTRGEMWVTCSCWTPVCGTEPLLSGCCWGRDDWEDGGNITCWEGIYNKHKANKQNCWDKLTPLHSYWHVDNSLKIRLVSNLDWDLLWLRVKVKCNHLLEDRVEGRIGVYLLDSVRCHWLVNVWCQVHCRSTWMSIRTALASSFLYMYTSFCILFSWDLPESVIQISTDSTFSLYSRTYYLKGSGCV